MAIIPARYDSQRFPGKVLADLNGKPVIQHVFERVASVFKEVYIATDDERISSAAASFGGRAVMTSTRHQSGTDRLAEACRLLYGDGRRPDLVLNIQADEPFIRTDALQSLIGCFGKGDIQIATLARRIDSRAELADPNVVKVVTGTKGRALYFSRSPLPYLRNAGDADPVGRFGYLMHLGVYGYRYQVLQEITRLAQSPLEKAESLEQLRWLEHGYSIHVALTGMKGIGIDTPEDLAMARELLLPGKG